MYRYMKNRIHSICLLLVAAILAQAVMADEAALKERIERLVRQLGAKTFPERQEAQKQLARLPRRAAKILNGLLKQDDPEVRARVLDTIRALTNAVPIDSVCDGDWQPEESSPMIESVPIALKDGSSMSVSLEYGEMDCYACEQNASFLSHTNRLTFRKDEQKRFGFQIGASKPFRVFTFATHPPMVSKEGEWTTSYMFPSEQIDRKQYYFFDYTRLDVDRPGTFSFAIYVNGFKVRTLNIEVDLPGAKGADGDIAGNHTPHVGTQKRVSSQELVGLVERHISGDRIVHVSSQREGQLTIEGGWRGNTYELAPLSDISFLKGLDIEDLTLEALSVSDLSPLSGLPLRSAKLYNLKATDLAPLAGLPLTNLVLGLAVTDLSPLKNVPLKSLELCGSRLKELSCLQEMKITKLSIDMECVSGTNIWQLGTLPLTDLEVYNCAKGHDFSWLSKMTRLSRLVLGSERPVDLSVLRTTSIKEIELCNGWVKDISALRGLKLTRFKAVSGKLTDISPLEGMPLKVVHIEGTGVKDLAPLKGAPIEELNIDGTKVRDVSVLRGMPLKKLDMGDTAIQDLTPLEGMRLESLRLGDLSAVKKGLETVRSMNSVRYLRATASRQGSYVLLEDWAPVFWKKYDDFRKK